jgi:hypothetical protein
MRNYGTYGTRESFLMFRAFRGLSELLEEKTWQKGDKSPFQR